MRRSLLFLIATVLSGTSAARAENWPEFRGPTGQGHSADTGLPIRWSETENVAWKTGIPGEGWSSPIVYEGRLYLTAAVPKKGGHANDRSLRTLCLDEETGAIVWNVEVFDQQGAQMQPIHGKNSHASPTPVTDGKFLFVHFGTQGTACLALDGKPVWKTRELAYQPQHGNGGSPVLADEVLVVSCDGIDHQFVVGLERRTGKIRWKTPRPDVANSRKFSFGTPLVIEVNGEKQIVCPGTDIVAAYSPADGKEIWRVRYDGYSVIPRPIYGHGLIYMCTGWGQPSLLAIRPTGRGDVTATHIAWQSNRGIPHTPSLLLVGDELYFVSDRGVASCVDAKTGQVHWQERVGGNHSASPLFADGKIYFQSEEGETIVVKAGTDFVELARNQLGKRSLASPAAADSSLFIRTDERLYRISNASR
jgi:outer membrane protein assembly factor BamB